MPYAPSIGETSIMRELITWQSMEAGSPGVRAMRVLVVVDLYIVYACIWTGNSFHDIYDSHIIENVSWWAVMPVGPEER
jgi:hypothetical protein